MVELRVGPGKTLPDRLCLIPDEYRDAKLIKAAVARYAEGWERGETGARAVDDLLRRRAPRVAASVVSTPGVTLSEAKGPNLDVSPLRFAQGDSENEHLPDLVARLDHSTLCIQGPPGTGKTYTAAAIIVHLLSQGKRIGVTAQSHKVILNLMGAVHRALGQAGRSAPLYKVRNQSGEDDPLIDQGIIQTLESDDVAGVLGAGAVLVGGTAWVFSRPELAGAFDYLFVDEAGQVSLANAVAVGLSARNLILIGDQMQLAQPTQGSHPGETGLSCLEYALHGHATIPPDMGVFLGTSRRMHPDVCRFISEALYDGRLGSTPDTARHRVIRGTGATLVPSETGIAWVPVTHDGCGQSSDEECEVIVAIVGELLDRDVVGADGATRRMTLGDILIVAPFNMQVRCLQERLGAGARIGSVDKFQGQEAAVVIVSLCSSTLDESPRGAAFLLSPNRLNVAVSRAQALAIVVGSPELLETRCRSVEEMKLVNLLCHLVQYSEGLQCSVEPAPCAPRAAETSVWYHREAPMYDDLDPAPPPMPAVHWNIGRQGRAWSGDEAHERWELTPEKFEMDRGKLFWDETQRLTCWRCCWRTSAWTRRCDLVIRRCGGRRTIGPAEAARSNRQNQASGRLIWRPSLKTAQPARHLIDDGSGQPRARAATSRRRRQRVARSGYGAT